MNLVERAMRGMTHFNIGAALGLAAWVLWSGWQVVSGQITPTYRAGEVKALLLLAHAAEPTPMQIVPVDAAAQVLPPCHSAAPAPARAAAVLSGADL